MRALQRAQRKQAQAAAQAARTQSAQAWQPYEKSRLQEQETEEKHPKGLTDAEISAYRKKHYRKMVHPLTGETHWIPKNSENNRNHEK